MEVLDKDGLEYYNDLIDKKFLKRTGGKVTGHVSGVTAPSGDNSTKFATTAFVQKAKAEAKSEANAYTDTGVASANAYTDEQIRQHASIPVGHEYFTMNPKIPQGSLPLFGGLCQRSYYPDLWEWVQNQTGYLKTEAEWQEISAANNGNVPYYSRGDGSTTFRLPSLRCWVKGANGTVHEVGSYLAAGLPNITGSAYVIGGNKDKVYTGAFGHTNDGPYTADESNSPYWYQVKLDISASRSNSIYGNSSTVQPESIVGMWLVKAWGTVEETGTINEQQYIDDRIAALPVSLTSTFLPLAGGQMEGDITFYDDLYLGSPLDADGKKTIYPGLYSNKNDSHHHSGIGFANASENLRAQTVISAGNGSYRHFLVLYGDEDGGLEYDDVDISINKMGNGYIRYNNGVQICWGGYNGSASLPLTITYPEPFTALPSIGIQSGEYNATEWQYTGFQLAMAAGHTKPSTIYFKYIAIGYWK